jgi:hypothetical protein
MYQDLNAVQRDVLLQCLLAANHKPKKWEWQGKIFKCQAGQFITSLDSLVKLCANGTSIQNVRTALVKLEKWQFLTNESTKTGRLITVTNWDTYQNQDDEANKGINKELTKSQQSSNKELTTNKNVKKDKNEKKELLAGFDTFWKAYPKKKSKGQAEITWDKISPTNDLLKTMLIAIEAAKTSEDWLKDNGKYIPHPSSWLNNKGWQDEVIEAKDCEVIIDGETVWMTQTEYKQWREDNERI